MPHGTVLLAAPPSLHRNGFHAALVRRGLHAFTADDGVQCLEFLRKSLPDVLVLELELPWGGGDGVLEVFHKELEFHEVPVLALTTGRSRSLLYRISRFTISDLAVLPVSAERLANCVVRLTKNFETRRGEFTAKSRPGYQPLSTSVRQSAESCSIRLSDPGR